MTDDLEFEQRIFDAPTGARVNDAWEVERDTFDNADAFAILDDASVRLAVCQGCGRVDCRCCPTCNTHPCRCGPPLSQAEIRAMSVDRAQRVVRR